MIGPVCLWEPKLKKEEEVSETVCSFNSLFRSSRKEGFLFMWVLDRPEHRESNLTVLCPLGWKWVACEATGGWTTVRRLAATVWRFGTWWFFCWRGSWTACRSALGGDGVDGHHYWWPCGLSRRIWVIFLQKRRKILGSKNSHVFQCRIFAVESQDPVLLKIDSREKEWPESWQKCAQFLEK